MNIAKKSKVARTARLCSTQIFHVINNNDDNKRNIRKPVRTARPVVHGGRADRPVLVSEVHQLDDIRR